MAEATSDPGDLGRRGATASRARGLSFAGCRIHAVLLDVDGTLYHQAPLRRRMALELSSLLLRAGSPRAAVRVGKVLQVFRRIREELRGVTAGERILEELQYDRTWEATGVPVAEIRRIVREWILERPLRHIPSCVRPDLLPFLSFLERSGVQAGVFSDYEVRAKLDALGLSARVSVAVAATDRDVNAFKPHPAGFRQACRLWGLAPHEVLYIGDRPEVDATGAERTGMPCAILARKAILWRTVPAAGYLEFRSFSRLQEAFDATDEAEDRALAVRPDRPD